MNTVKPIASAELDLIAAGTTLNDLPRYPDMPDTMDHVGNALKRIRLNRDLTMTEAARLAGLTRNTWSSYEKRAYFEGHATLLKQVLETMDGVSPLTSREINPIASRADIDDFLKNQGYTPELSSSHTTSDPSPYTASAHSLLDAVIALLGPRATLGILNQTLAIATAGLESQADPRDA